LQERLLTVTVAGLVVALVLPAVLAIWATVAWLMSGVFIRHVRATPLEWLAFLVFTWGLLIAVSALYGMIAGCGIEAFTRERPRSALRMALGVVLGALAGALAAGTLKVSLASGQPDVPEKTPLLYWLCGPGLAVACGIAGIIVERNNER